MNNITHKGEIVLGNSKISCYVLEDGRRVLSGRGMQGALKMVDDEDASKTAGTRLNRYLEQQSLKPYLYKNKNPDIFKPIECYQGKMKINGYEASVLVEICDAFLEARQNLVWDEFMKHFRKLISTRRKLQEEERFKQLEMEFEDPT
ncbi:hypothetical protein [Cyanothece sp. BG0011]|uniref:hypothetical protein n=1 Tax=Cyanothece sp. BG0011 TaxID=2082950 RepID=UPI000D1F58F6|nr:hypothetical protein [Cyanothece sp. BG0011]